MSAKSPSYYSGVSDAFSGSEQFSSGKLALSILARRNAEPLAEAPGEMGGTVEAPAKGDLGDRMAAPARIGELVGTFLEPAAHHISEDRLLTGGKDHAQIPRRKLHLVGDH